MNTFKRAGVSLLAVGAIGYGAHEGANAMFGVDQERVAQYDACIPHAGKIATQQTVLPEQCQPLADTFSKDVATGQPILPSQATLRIDRDQVIYDGGTLDTVRTVITGAGGISGGAAALMLTAGRRRRVQTERQGNYATGTAQ